MNINELNKKVFNNLIYCEDTHSLVHRLMMKLYPKDNKTDWQITAYDCLEDMIQDLKNDKK
jgi:hypothetical protein